MKNYLKLSTMILLSCFLSAAQAMNCQSARSVAKKGKKHYDNKLSSRTKKVCAGGVGTVLFGALIPPSLIFSLPALGVGVYKAAEAKMAVKNDEKVEMLLDYSKELSSQYRDIRRTKKALKAEATFERFYRKLVDQRFEKSNTSSKKLNASVYTRKQVAQMLLNASNTRLICPEGQETKNQRAGGFYLSTHDIRGLLRTNAEIIDENKRVEFEMINVQEREASKSKSSLSDSSSEELSSSSSSNMGAWEIEGKTSVAVTTGERVEEDLLGLLD